MLNRIIGFSIANKLIIGICTLALIVYGIYEVFRLPIDAVPDITNNQVQVITVTPALGAPDVERLITFPIEQVNNNIPGLIEQRSFSRFGLSVVTIVFSDETDIYWARQQVSERLKLAQEQIPAGIGTPVLAPLTTGLGEIYQYTVRAKAGYENRYNTMDLRTIQDWIVRRQLLGVEGVAEVSSFGGRLKQYEIAIDPAKLLAADITIGDVFSALEKNNHNTGGAYIEKGGAALFIRSEGLVTNLDDIRNILIKNLPDGMPLLVQHVAEVRLGHATRYGAMIYNGDEEVTGAIVMMLKGANSNIVIRNIRERIAQIQKTLPEGVVIDPFLDRTKMVNNAIGTVSKNLLEGALIVVFVLVLLLGNLRAGLLVASVIPLSMLFAVIMMNIFHVSGNLMSLGALDFGLIVDGAVIIVEAVMHRLSHSTVFNRINRLSQSDMDREVKHAAGRMMNSAVFGQIIILVVYLPIFTLQGIEGKMFKPMAQTVAFALAGAFILSLTYIPMMSALFLSKNLSHQPSFSDRIMQRLERFYQYYLLKALRNQIKMLSVVGVLFVFALWMLSRLGGEFIPSLPEGDLAIEMRVLTGSSLQTSIDVSSKASKILLAKFPEIEKVVGKIGNSEVPTDPMPMNATDLIIILKDRNSWTSATTYPELEAKMEHALHDIPGASFGFQYPVSMRFNELMTGARQDVVCKIFGENLDTLAYYAEKLGTVCKSVDGNNALYVEAVTGMPQIVIRYNRSMIAQYGLSIAEVNRVVNTAFAGESSGTVYEGEKRFEMVVRLTGEKRKNLPDVQNLLIATPAGTQIPLSALATVQITDGPNQIQRENSQRRIIVGFNVRGRDVQSMVHELQQKVDQQITLPSGYYITYGGAFENLQAAKSRLYLAVPVSLALIFLLLFFAFGSVKQGLLIYSAIPLSAIGGILALAARDIPFSISAGVGFIALFGVAVLNGIVLIAEFNRLKTTGYTNLLRIVAQGTKVRLRPVLMTALVASLGFLPMALSKGEGAEVQRPLATVVIGGLLLATLLTLFVLPVLYTLFSREKTHSKQVLIPVVLLCLATFQSRAQTPITLRQAIDTALQNNLRVKNELLQAVYQKKLKSAAVDLPQTSLTGQYGQYNSAYTDNQFGVSQSFNFPSVYAKQKTVQHQLYKNSILNVKLQETELKKEVGNMFYLLIYMQEKEKLLLFTDSLYALFLEKSAFRFEKGESNILEKTTAETQRGQIALQLHQLRTDKEIVLLRFQLLLNTHTLYIPETQTPKLSFFQATDSTLLTEHPRIKMLQQEQQISKANTRLQRSKLWPDLNIGYMNTTIRGIGADDILYSGSNRFSYLHFGVGVPIFFNAQQARISSGKIQQQISDNNLRAGILSSKMEYEAALKKYQTQLQQVSYFESSALPGADLIIQTAGRQFSSGDISYLEWAMLINNATTIRSNYADALKELNETIIQLHYLTNTSIK